MATKTKSKITSMEFLKGLADKVNVPAYIEGSKESAAAGINIERRPPDEYEKGIFSITFYDNICFVNKAMRDGVNSFGVAEWIEHNNEVPKDDDYE